MPVLLPDSSQAVFPGEFLVQVTCFIELFINIKYGPKYCIQLSNIILFLNLGQIVSAMRYFGLTIKTMKILHHFNNIHYFYSITEALSQHCFSQE